MALGKMLNLGGMENSLPKTNQNSSRFRVAENVQPTVDGKLVPRSSYGEAAGQPSSMVAYSLLKDYGEKIFKMGVYHVGLSGNEYRYYLDNDRIGQSNEQGGEILSNEFLSSYSVMSFRKNNTLYILNPLEECSFFKYDGVEITGCGSSQPRFSCADYSTAGTDYVKVIQHRIDFDNIEVLSETVTFPILTATNTVTIRTDELATPIVNAANIGVSPSDLVTANPNTMSDLFFFGTATYNAGTQDYTISYTETNISDNQVGSYVFLGNNNSIPSYWPGLNYKLLALKVKSASPLTLDALNAKAMPTGTFEWQNIPGAITSIAGTITFGFRKLFSVWGSSSLTGNYTLRKVHPAFPESLISRTFTADTTTMGTPIYVGQLGNLPVNVGLNLGDFYDTTSRKLSLNTDYRFGGIFKGVTSYQDQLLWWNDDLIYFSDPTLGGSVEHPSAGSFIRVGDSEYGNVISVCGTQDYLVVSREKKNYFVNGNLATGNYRVQDIAEIEIGAWCNNGTINIKDSVILINAIGVWQIQGGGRASFLSKQISENFSTYDGYPVPAYSFKIQGFMAFVGSPTPLNPLYVDTGLDIAFDEYREYLVFCNRSVEGAPILVLHTKTGEFYEWIGFGTATRSLAFNRGIMHYGTIDQATYLAKVKSESPIPVVQDYAATYPIKLYSTWLTAGEPSLEKQLLQLKMFGIVTPSGGNSINVVHFKDWQLTKVTNAAYIPDSATQFSHLKRLNSDKVLAASVGFEVVNNGVTFEVESFEVEFNPIQQGVKR